MSTAPSPLAAEIKRRREALGLEQKVLSRKAKLGETAVRDIEEGRAKHPRIDTIRALAKALGCSAGDLTREGPPRPHQEGEAGERIYAIAELDVRASMGGGALVDEEREIATWSIPRDLLRGQTTAPLAGLKIITAYGDSMAPELPPGTRVLVDTGDLVPSPPGIFVVWDGLGLVIKRIEYVAHSDPATVRITSDNTRYAPYERTLDEAHIRGRIIGLWTWK